MHSGVKVHHCNSKIKRYIPFNTTIQTIEYIVNLYLQVYIYEFYTPDIFLYNRTRILGLNKVLQSLTSLFSLTDFIRKQ